MKYEELTKERNKRFVEKVFYGCERTYDNITNLFGTDGYEILNCLTYGM